MNTLTSIYQDIAQRTADDQTEKRAKSKEGRKPLPS